MKVGNVEVEEGVLVLGSLDVSLSDLLVSTEFELCVEPELVLCGREVAEVDSDEVDPDEDGLDVEEELEDEVDPERLLLSVDDVSETDVGPLALLDPGTDPEEDPERLEELDPEEMEVLLVPEVIVDVEVRFPEAIDDVLVELVDGNEVVLVDVRGPRLYGERLEREWHIIEMDEAEQTWKYCCG